MRIRQGVAALTLVLSATLPVGSILAQQGQSETTLQAAGKHYEAGWFHRFLLGSEYREVWTTPITVPVLDMDTYAGGVRAVSRTGGQQSKSLRLQATDGRQFFSAQSTRIPGALPEELRQTVRGRRGAGSDQLGAAHRAPGGGPALKAAGILHPIRRSSVLPDVERGGDSAPSLPELMEPSKIGSVDRVQRRTGAERPRSSSPIPFMPGSNDPRMIRWTDPHSLRPGCSMC
jgi:hypothetical protein